MVHHEGNGNLILDLTLGKLGRFKGVSGTTDPDLHRAIATMLRQLRRERKWDMLAVVANRLVRPVDFYDTVIRGEADTLPTGDEGKPVLTTMERWLDVADLADGTKNDYRRLMTEMAGEKATLGDLPDLIRGLGEKSVKDGRRRTFNLTRAAVLSLLNAILDDNHKLYRAVRRIRELEVTVREGNPQTVEQIREIAPAMGPDAGTVWAFCLTGMRSTEYYDRPWKETLDRIQVSSAKKKGIIRVIPKPYSHLQRARVQSSRFYHKLYDVTDGAVNIHDLRKTAQRWWEDAGVESWRVSYYAGHAVAKDMRVIYRKPREMANLLKEDAARVRTYLGDAPNMTAGLKLA